MQENQIIVTLYVSLNYPFINLQSIAYSVLCVDEICILFQENDNVEIKKYSCFQGLKTTLEKMQILSWE